jgi:hypothetical protein
MKTPRELLLQRHLAAEPKLKAICRVVVENIHNEETKQPSAVFVSWFLGCSRNFWRELIWPNHRGWAGLAAVWAVILAMNLYSADPAARLVKAEAAPSTESLLVLRAQRRELAKLIEPTETRDAEKPKAFPPSPRSERRNEMLAA